MGLVLAIFTNGTLVTGEIARRLAQAPPSRTEITLYGATAATYETVTGVPGSYQRCCAGIETLIACNVPLGLKSTITRQNVGELEAMRQMARDWDIPFSASWLLSRRRDGRPSDVEDCRLSGSACAALEASDRASADHWTEVAIRGPSTDNQDNFFCQAGKATFSVTPTGEMVACQDLPFPASRPCEIGFRAAWSEVQQYVDSIPRLDPDCLACEVRGYCSRCPGRSYMDNGTLSGPAPYLCEIAQARRARYERRD
jgi:radical SAM protein with 4Fe4S-binding SPASM domain